MACINPESIRPLLIHAGMPPELAKGCAIEPVEEGALAITFKLIAPGGTVSYLKFSEIEGAKGGAFLKHLLPIDQESMREHSEKRRRFVRKALDSVVQHRLSLVPRPLYFDLKPTPMSEQKAKAGAGVVAEERISSMCEEPLLANTVMTLWAGINITHLPLLAAEMTNVWDSTNYTPESIFECAAALGELQTKTALYLRQVLERKVEKGKGSPPGY